MISVDTEQIKQLASIARTSNDAINDAMNALNQVTTHNDWGCRERTQLNEYIQKNKTKMKQIQEASSNYLRVISDVAGEFETVEREIPNLFESVEGVISQIIGVVTPTTIISKKALNICKSISKIDQGELHTGTWGGANIFDSIGSPISIVKFHDIDLLGK